MKTEKRDASRGKSAEPKKAPGTKQTKQTAKPGMVQKDKPIGK